LLPHERITEVNIFKVSGIDYIEPLFLKKVQKACIYLFTYAVYRAINLELTTSLSTEAFLQVLQIYRATWKTVHNLHSNETKNDRKNRPFRGPRVLIRF